MNFLTAKLGPICRNSNSIARALRKRYFDPSLPLPIQTFNLLGTAGAAAGLIVALSCLISGAGTANIAINLGAFVLALVLLRLARKTGRYDLCGLVVVIAVFIVAFPALFFTAGGYRSGMPCFFPLALVFTATMLEGWRRASALATELAVYFASCLVAYFRPQTVTHFAAESDYLLDVMVGIAVSGTLLFLVAALCARAGDNHRLELRRLNQELADGNERLKSLNSVKSDFLSTVSHELNSPLAALSGAAGDTLDLLETAPPDLGQIADNQRSILETVKRIKAIVSDLQDTVAIERGALALDAKPVSMASVLRDFCSTRLSRLDAGGVALSLSLADGLPEIPVDRARIEQVMSNLLSNAARHAKKGRIAVTLSPGEREQLVSVADEGEGMPADMLEGAFEGGRTTQMEPWRHGVGLNLCREIVAAHGGRIWLESEPGRGTRAFFALLEKEAGE